MCCEVLRSVAMFYRELSEALCGEVLLVVLRFKVLRCVVECCVIYSEVWLGVVL